VNHHKLLALDVVMSQIIEEIFRSFCMYSKHVH